MIFKHDGRLIHFLQNCMQCRENRKVVWFLQFLSEGKQINEEQFLFVFIAPPGGEPAYFSCMLILLA